MHQFKILSKKIGLMISCFLVCFFGFSLPAGAQTVSVDDFNPSVVEVQQEPAALVNNIVNLVFVVAAALSFCFLVYGAISWIAAGGDSSKLESARKMIVGAIIGLLILASVWAIFTLVMNIAFDNTKGIEVPSLTGGSGGSGGGGGSTTTYTCGKNGEKGTCKSGQTCVQIQGGWTCK